MLAVIMMMMNNSAHEERNLGPSGRCHDAASTRSMGLILRFAGDDDAFIGLYGRLHMKAVSRHFTR